MHLVAVSALGALVYTYAGYPFLVALWASVAPRKISAREDLNRRSAYA